MTIVGNLAKGNGTFGIFSLFGFLLLLLLSLLSLAVSDPSNGRRQIYEQEQTMFKDLLRDSDVIERKESYSSEIDIRQKISLCGNSVRGGCPKLPSFISKRSAITTC